MEKLQESVSLYCVYLVGQDEAVGAECEQGCAQVSSVSYYLWWVHSSAVSPPGSALITVRHMLRVCDDRDTGWPEPCPVLRIMSSPGCCLDCGSLSSVSFPLSLVCKED